MTLARFSPRILVVDDELTVRRLTAVLLQRTGFRVASAANGASALELIASEGMPALAIVDFMMPVMDGEEFVATVRRRGCWFPIIMASASLEAPEIARRLSIQAFLAKPYDVEQLVASIRSLLQVEARLSA